MNRIPEDQRRRQRGKAADAGDPSGHRGPRSVCAARVREHADLSRLDRALPQRRGFPPAQGQIHLRHQGNSDHRLARSRLDRPDRRGRDGAGSLRPGGDFDRAAVLPQIRRPFAGAGLGLSADAQFLRLGPASDSASRRPITTRCSAPISHASSSPTRARCSPRRRVRCRSRCRIFRRSRRSRMRATRSC